MDFGSFPVAPLGIFCCVLPGTDLCQSSPCCKVGPGTFERKDVSIGPQYLSKRKNHSTYSFARGPKFGRATSSDDVARSVAVRLGMVVNFFRNARVPAGHPVRMLGLTVV